MTRVQHRAAYRVRSKYRFTVGVVVICLACLSVIQALAARADGQTRLVRDVRTGPDPSYPDGFVGIGNVLFFVANDGVHGAELWRSDGTDAGTHMVVDLNPGPTGAFENYDVRLVVLGDKLFFGANDGRNGAQLWQSDGTAKGTSLVKDVASGEFSAVRQLVAVGGRLYFMATTGFYAPEGAPDGHDRLWQSDGTTAGTVAVTDLGIYAPRGGFGEYKMVERLQSLNDALLATISDGTECCETVSLVRVDATGESQTLFDRYGSHGPHGDLRPPHNLTVVDGALFFTLDDGYGDIDCELWRTDGTPAGTLRVAVPQPACGMDQLAAREDGTLFFTHFEDTGTGLWKVDASGLNPTLITVPARSYVEDLTQVGGILFFVGWTGHERALWASDGTATGTVEVRGFPGALAPSSTALAKVDGTLLFTADDGHTGPGVWKSDGTPGGTMRVAPLPSDPGYVFSPLVTMVGDDVFFIAQDDAHGAELWALPVHALNGDCPADCDTNRVVTVDELLIGVNIALGGAPLSACEGADFNGDDQVTIDELVIAVSRALNGCG